MKENAELPRARLEATMQRLSECIACASRNGVVTETYMKVVRRGWAFEFLDPAVKTPLYVWRVAHNALIAQDKPPSLWTPIDKVLITAWNKLQVQEDVQAQLVGFMAWRLEALDRICELFYDQREIQARLLRNETDWLKAMRRGGMESSPMAEQLALEEEESVFIQKLKALRTIEEYDRIRCDVGPGVPCGLLEQGEPPRVAFLQRQLRWTQTQIGRSIRDCASQEPWLADRQTLEECSRRSREENATGERP